MAILIVDSIDTIKGRFEEKECSSSKWCRYKNDKGNNINLVTDNFNSSIDTHHEFYKKIDVKTESPEDRDKWKFHTHRKWNCGHYFCLGMDEKWSSIESVLIIPNEGWITNVSQVNITRYPTQYSKYDQFRVDAKTYNDAYQDLLNFLKGRGFISIEDMKSWLKGE